MYESTEQKLHTTDMSLYSYHWLQIIVIASWFIYFHDYINNKLLYELKRCKNSVMHASVICSPSAQQMSTYLEAKWLPYDHLTQSDPV